MKKRKIEKKFYNFFKASLDKVTIQEYTCIKIKKERAPKGEKVKIMTMKEWAKAHNLEGIYNEYHSACEEISAECEAEGYPSHGSNYELRVEELEKLFPELFGDDEAEGTGFTVGRCEDEIIG